MSGAQGEDEGAEVEEVRRWLVLKLERAPGRSDKPPRSSFGLRVCHHCCPAGGGSATLKPRITRRQPGQEKKRRCRVAMLTVSRVKLPGDAASRRLKVPESTARCRVLCCRESVAFMLTLSGCCRLVCVCVTRLD